MASLTLKGIEKELGGNKILRGIDLAVEDGELVVLVGPSGCGKSTLLRTIAGLELPDMGSIKIGEDDVTTEPPRKRDVAMVFQSYALYPHLDVRANLSFGLKLRGKKKALIHERVNEVASMLGLSDLLDRYPREMSGGQRQRVAMGRAIARRPRLFLFDEPLSNLDAALRGEVRIEIKRLHRTLGATMVYVTHDQVEAMTLADRLVVLNEGRVEQVGPPLEVYRKPANRFVAGFMGSPPMNFVPASATGFAIELPSELDDSSDDVICGVRPHDLMVTDDGPIELVVEVIEAMGFEAFAHGKVGDTAFAARIEAGVAEEVAPGETLRLAAQDGALHFFDAVTGHTLG